MHTILEILKSTLSAFVILLNEMSPYLLLGFIFAGMLHVLVPQRHIVRYLGKNDFRSVLNAALIGIPIPLCSCGVIPTGLSLYKNGASKGSAVSFLISTPQTGIDSIMITYSLLGLPLAIIRPIIALISGVIGGWFTNNNTFKEDISSNENPYKENKIHKFKNPVLNILHYAFIDFFQDIAKWLVIGLILATLIAVIIPDGFFTTYLSNGYLSMLIMLVASAPLYICATGSVPIAAMLIMKGLSPGAALVFLIAGPATNAATITMVGKILGRNTLLIFLITTIITALFFGTVVNELLPRSWFMPAMMMDHSHHHEEIIPYWLQITSSIILGLLLLNVWRLKLTQNRKQYSENNIQSPTINIETKIYGVKGMTCNHCKANVENNLQELPGIKNVNANLQQESIIISAEHLDMEAIRTAIENLGYTFTGEKK